MKTASGAAFTVYLANASYMVFIHFQLYMVIAFIYPDPMVFLKSVIFLDLLK